MIRRPPRSTLFPSRRSSDLTCSGSAGASPSTGGTRASAARAGRACRPGRAGARSEEHTSELQSRRDLVCRLLLEKKKKKKKQSNKPKKNINDQYHKNYRQTS